MNNKNDQLKIWAIERYLSSEKPISIVKSIGKSKSWFYKWLSRYDKNNPLWNKKKSKTPKYKPLKTSYKIEEAIKIIRLHLYNNGLFHGAQAIQWEFKDMNINPIPSLRTINRILQRNNLTHRRTGKYIPKGTPYPKLTAEFPNHIHQADFVGPLYLSGPIRFYSLNVVDIATSRCGIQPLFSCNSQNSIDSLWSIWWRLGIPKYLQVDNELAFYGSNRYPRAMGALIRLCLLNNVEPWFIPVREPWRNGVVEKFNDHFRQKFFNKVIIRTEDQLFKESLQYENRHNNEYRYSKLKGSTPMKYLLNSTVSLRFPNKKEPPKHPLPKPKTGCYHFIRLIRSNLCLNIFTEKFYLPSDLMYEYVIATVNVKEQKLKIFHNNKLVEEYNYK